MRSPAPLIHLILLVACAASTASFPGAGAFTWDHSSRSLLQTSYSELAFILSEKTFPSHLPPPPPPPPLLIRTKLSPSSTSTSMLSHSAKCTPFTFHCSYCTMIVSPMQRSSILQSPPPFPRVPPLLQRSSGKAHSLGISARAACYRPFTPSMPLMPPACDHTNNTCPANHFLA